MFRAAYLSSSGALTVFAASGLHTHVVSAVVKSVWEQALLVISTESYYDARGQFLPRPDYGRSPQAYVNQRLQIQLELLMMSGMLLETC
jgi:hypothetical protein